MVKEYGMLTMRMLTAGTLMVGYLLLSASRVQAGEISWSYGASTHAYPVGTNVIGGTDGNGGNNTYVFFGDTKVVTLVHTQSNWPFYIPSAPSRRIPNKPTRPGLTGRA
jgi:hypothetical protein